MCVCPVYLNLDFSNLYGFNHHHPNRFTFHFNGNEFVIFLFIGFSGIVCYEWWYLIFPSYDHSYELWILPVFLHYWVWIFFSHSLLSLSFRFFDHFFRFLCFFFHVLLDIIFQKKSWSILSYTRLRILHLNVGSLSWCCLCVQQHQSFLVWKKSVMLKLCV